MTEKNPIKERSGWEMTEGSFVVGWLEDDRTLAERILDVGIRVGDYMVLSLLALLLCTEVLNIWLVLFAGVDLTYSGSQSSVSWGALIVFAGIVVLFRERINSRIRWALVLMASAAGFAMFAVDWPGFTLFLTYFILPIGGWIYIKSIQNLPDFSGDTS